MSSQLQNPWRATILMTGLLCFMLAACVRAKPENSAQTPSSPSPSPKMITTADLKKLRWIEGAWRGTGGNVPTFYERYKFESESTLVVETLADETLSKVTDASRFELKDGNFGYRADGAASLATALDDNSITFHPFGKPANSFRWQRESAGSWRAILNWTDKNGVAKERVYIMERLAPAKP